MKPASQNRKRSTKAELDGLRDRIVRIAFASHPLSVRNLFYQLLSDDGSGVTVEKSESAYQKVGRLKTLLCRDGSIPWHYFADSSRVSYDNDGFEGLGDTTFVDRVASLYRRDYSSASSASANSAKAISASRARAVPRLRTSLYRAHLISASTNRW